MNDESEFITALLSGTSVTVKVRPSAQKTCLKGRLDDGTWKIDVAAVPEDGKANEELVRYLAEMCGVSRSMVEVVSGQTNRLKIVRLKKSD